MYSDPESFDLERFLPPRNEPDFESETFGYGRRVCPGRFFADDGLDIVQTLTAFSISKAVGEDGKEIDVHVSQSPGILTYRSNCDVIVKPRSNKYVELIRQLEKQPPEESSDAGFLESLHDCT